VLFPRIVWLAYDVGYCPVELLVFVDFETQESVVLQLYSVGHHQRISLSQSVSVLMLYAGHDCPSKSHLDIPFTTLEEGNGSVEILIGHSSILLKRELLFLR